MRVLLVTVVKYTLSQCNSHCTWNYIFWYFLETGNSCFMKKNCSKSYICVFILSKKEQSWLQKDLCYSVIVGYTELSHPLLNCIFNILLISVSINSIVSPTFLLVSFVCLKESTCETRENVFYFTFKALLVLQVIKF